MRVGVGVGIGVLRHKMVEAQVPVDVATTPVVRSKERRSRSKSKSKSKPHYDPSPSSSNAITSSPRKWTLFHRGNRTTTTSSKKPITLFQSRRRRQKQHNPSPKQDTQSTDREPPINDSQSKTGILRRAAKKQNARVLGPPGTTTGTNDALQLPVLVATEQSVASQTDSPTMQRSDHELQANSSQRSCAADDMTTRTACEQTDSNQVLHTSESGATPATYTTTTGKGTDPQGSERAVLIFDREKRASTSDATLQDKNVKRNRFTIVGKTVGAVVGIVILYWLVVYLSTKIVEGGQRMISLYHNFTSRMLTLGHILRIGFTVAAWGGTIFGWGYIVKNTKKFIERRRSDINLNNAGDHTVDPTDDYALINQHEKCSSRASFHG